MKILLVSDTHGNNEILKDLYRCYPNVDLYLHAGDSEAYDASLIHPFISVRGNCDYNYSLPNTFEFDTPKGKLLLKHVPYLSESERKGIKIFCHGHTHQEEVRVVNNILYICPGSLSLSRKGKESYMTINITNESMLITLREIDNHKIVYKKQIRL